MIHIYKNQYRYMEEVNYGILKHIPLNQSQGTLNVLDVGCGSGVLSEAIKKKGYTVWGIEVNRDAAHRAVSRIDKVIHEDLVNIEKIKETIGNKRFEYIVFSNVLEHLYDPYLVLKKYLQFLAQDGLVLISVPNVAVWTNRIKLLFGKFDYTDTGTMDRTHIRFFTFKTAKMIIRESGCSIVKVDFTPFVVRAMLPFIKKNVYGLNQEQHLDARVIIDSQLYQFYQRYIYPLEYALSFPFKTIFAYSIIVVGKKR